MTEVIHSAGWSVHPPQEWAASHDPECLTITDPNETAALQFSSAIKDGAVLDSDLRDFASDHLEAGAHASPCRKGDFEGFEIAFGDGESYWRHWYFRNASRALFVTYCCAIENRGGHDAAVNDALATLTATGDDVA